jgi:glycosyltransferase involved in cell wall biosynthesis
MTSAAHEPSVVVLAPYLTRDQAGAAQAMINIVNALDKRLPGDVVVVTFAHDPALLSGSIPIIELEPYYAPRFFWRFPSVFTLDAFYRRLRDAQVPRAELCYTMNTLMGLAYRRLHREPLIASHTGAVLADREFKEESSTPRWQVAIESKVIRQLEARSYRTSNWKHIVSTRLVAKLREESFRLPPGFFSVCPYGIDFKRFNRYDRHPDMRVQYGIPAAAFVLVTTARLIRWKNVDMILEAMALSQESLWLFVVGAGPEESRLKTLAAKLRLESRVRFVGHTNPAPFLAASNAFVLPSQIESFGMAYAEAMAMGLPCIGLRNRPPEVLSSAADVIPEGSAGYCVDTVAQLRDRIDALCRDPAKAAAMGESAYHLASTTYTTERYVDCLASVCGTRFGSAAERMRRIEGGGG